MDSCLPCGCLLLSPFWVFMLIDGWVKSNQEKEKRRLACKFQCYSIDDKGAKTFLLLENGASFSFEKKHIYREAFNTAREIYDYLYGKDGNKKNPYFQIHICRKNANISSIEYDNELIKEQYIAKLEELMFEKREGNQIEETQNLKSMPDLDNDDSQQIIQR
jgi:hypothetical protein